MIGCVFHVWPVGNGWDVHGEHTTERLARFANKDEALRWCKEHAHGSQRAQVCCWDPLDLSSDDRNDFESP